MQLISHGISNDAVIPGGLAFVVTGSSTLISFSTSRNPYLGRNTVLNETKSVVLSCHDPDVPAHPRSPITPWYFPTPRPRCR
jgi:phosphatidylethanolamine-binding protein (PEBP) family uncharacterized protein